MKKSQKISLVALFKIVLLTMLYQAPLHAEELSGYDIIYNAEERYNGDSRENNSTMVMINARGEKRIRKMKQYRKDFGENLKDEKTMTFFTSPSDINNTAYLNFDWDEENKDDDSWLFLPALKKVKRLASADKSDAFLGSDFTYTDIGSSKRHFWNYTVINESDMVDGHDCWVVEGLPREEIKGKVIRETGYQKVNIWVRKDIFMKVKGKFWIKKGKRIKYFKVSEAAKIGDVWVAVTQQMVTTKAKRVEHQTVMKMSNIKYNVPLDDSFFTTQQMKRGL